MNHFHPKGFQGEGFYNEDFRSSNIFYLKGLLHYKTGLWHLLNSFLSIHRTSNAYEGALQLPLLHKSLQKDQVKHPLYWLPFEKNILAMMRETGWMNLYFLCNTQDKSLISSITLVCQSHLQ